MTRSRTRADARLVEQVLRRNVWALAVANLVVGTAFILADPGTAPSLHFLQIVAPLPVWGAGHLATAALLLTSRYAAGHTLAVPLWLMWATGAVFGLVTGTTRSPTVSIALTALIAAVAGLHCNGWSFRRHETNRARETSRVDGGSRRAARDDQGSRRGSSAP